MRKSLSSLGDVGAATLGAAPLSRHRKRAITNLKLNGASRVLDVACGSGRNFALLRDALSGIGLVYGIDPSAAAIEKARRRIEKHGYADIALVQTEVEEYVAKYPFDAALCTFAIDGMQKWEEALEMMFGAVRSGGRIAVVGVKLSEKKGWRGFNPLVRFIGKRFGIEFGRGVREALKKKGCDEALYEEHHGGFYYVLVTEKRLEEVKF